MQNRLGPGLLQCRQQCRVFPELGMMQCVTDIQYRNIILADSFPRCMSTELSPAALCADPEQDGTDGFFLAVFQRSEAC